MCSLNSWALPSPLGVISTPTLVSSAHLHWFHQHTYTNVISTPTLVSHLLRTVVQHTEVIRSIKDVTHFLKGPPFPSLSPSPPSPLPLLQGQNTSPVPWHSLHLQLPTCSLVYMYALLSTNLCPRLLLFRTH